MRMQLGQSYMVMTCLTPSLSCRERGFMMIDELRESRRTPRKRWPAIEPSWHWLFADGSATFAMTESDARFFPQSGCRRGSGISPALKIVAIVKVTPK